MKKRYMFGIEIPEEGPEPGERSYEQEPHAIEFSGCRWAIATASGLCGFIAEDEGEFRSCMQNMLPKMLKEREEWESNTWTGLRRAAGLSASHKAGYL